MDDTQDRPVGASEPRTGLVWEVSYRPKSGQEGAFELSFEGLSSETGLAVGRDSRSNDINIPHLLLSRVHCRFTLDEQGNLCVSDRGSTNGTFINGLRLPPHMMVPIGPTDRVRIADLELAVTFPPAAVASTGPGRPSPPAARPGPEEVTIIGEALEARRSRLVAAMAEERASPGREVPQASAAIMESLLTFGARRPLISLLVTCIVTAIAAVGVLDLKIDVSYDSLFSKKDPGYIPYKGVVKEFGSDNISIIYLRDRNLFSSEKLALIEDLTFTLADLDFVEKSESLFTALNIRDADGMLDLGPLMNTVPEEASEIATVRDNALYSPLIRGNNISDDGNTTAVLVTVTNVEGDPTFNRRIFREIESRIAPLRKDFDEVFQVGPPRLNADIEQGLFADLLTMTPLSTVVLVGFIALFLRTFVAAALPLVTAGLSILWTAGFMGFAGIPLNLLTAVLPALVIVIGSTEDTHMVSAYLHGLPEKKPPSRLAAIRFMAIHVGLPIFITSFTTAVGFLSNAINELALIRDFGFASSFAMVANLFVTVLVLPMLLRWFGPLRARASVGPHATEGTIPKIVNVLDDLSDRHQGKIAAATLVMVLTLGALATNVRVSNDPLSYFKSDSLIVTHAEILHDQLAGMQVFYVTVDAERGTDFTDPVQLKRIERLVASMRSQGVYDKIISITDYIALVGREMHQGDPAHFRVPDTRELVQQYLLLFQRSDIERYIRADSRRVNILVRHNISDSWVLNEHLADLTRAADSILGDGMTFYLLGKNLMINRAAEGLFTGQLWSLGLLVVIIFVTMAFLYTSITAGVLSLIPNLIPIFVLFGTMGLIGIPLNPGTAIVAVIAVGIAVDDTIHLLSTYNAECRKDPDQAIATRNAVRAEALPVISTSLSLAAGFSLLYFSRFTVIAQFGMLSALTMLVAMVSDLLITPVFMKRFRLVGIWDVIATKFGREDLLLNSDLFQGMSRFQIRKAILLSQLREFDPGEIIIRQGDIGEDMYLVLSGIVEVVHTDEQGKKMVAVLGSGEVIGEAGFVGAARRTATVRVGAGEKLQLLVLNAEKTATSMRFYPRIGAKLSRNISRIMAQRLGPADGNRVHS